MLKYLSEDHNTISTQTIRRQLTPPTRSTPILTPRHTYCPSDWWSPLNNSITVQIHGTQPTISTPIVTVQYTQSNQVPLTHNAHGITREIY